MRFYTVHAAPGPAADPADAVFVKEGFCWPALLVPLFWLLYRRQWLVLFGWLAVTVAIAAAGNFADGPAVAAVSVLVALWFAAEANGLRRWTLERRGWRLVGVASGGRLVDAELGWFARAAADGMPPAGRSKPLPPAAGESGVIGLFPERGSRA